jgi:hypothetical protein
MPATRIGRKASRRLMFLVVPDREEKESLAIRTSRTYLIIFERFGFGLLRPRALPRQRLIFETRPREAAGEFNLSA